MKGICTEKRVDITLSAPIQSTNYCRSVCFYTVNYTGYLITAGTDGPGGSAGTNGLSGEISIVLATYYVAIILKVLKETMCTHTSADSKYIHFF